MFYYMTSSRLIDKCCKNHINAQTKSISLEITMNSAISSKLTSDEHDCLYKCNGYNLRCPNYNSYKEVTICVQ
jgi:hypothetical protein